MAFFNTVHYVGIKDSSIFGKFEQAANVCRAPRRWLAADLGLVSGSKVYTVGLINVNLFLQTNETSESQGIKRVVRLIISLFLSIPGEILGLTLMSAAYLSREIRLKHAISQRKLSPVELTELKTVLEQRHQLSKERQGRDEDGCATLLCCLCLTLICSANSDSERERRAVPVYIIQDRAPIYIVQESTASRL